MPIEIDVIKPMAFTLSDPLLEHQRTIILSKSVKYLTDHQNEEQHTIGNSVAKTLISSDLAVG